MLHLTSARHIRHALQVYGGRDLPALARALTFEHRNCFPEDRDEVAALIEVHCPDEVEISADGFFAVKAAPSADCLRDHVQSCELAIRAIAKAGMPAELKRYDYRAANRAKGVALFYAECLA